MPLNELIQEYESSQQPVFMMESPSSGSHPEQPINAEMRWYRANQLGLSQAGTPWMLINSGQESSVEAGGETEPARMKAHYRSLIARAAERPITFDIAAWWQRQDESTYTIQVDLTSLATEEIDPWDGGYHEVIILAYEMKSVLNMANTVRSAQVIEILDPIPSGETLNLEAEVEIIPESIEGANREMLRFVAFIEYRTEEGEWEVGNGVLANKGSREAGILPTMTPRPSTASPTGTTPTPSAIPTSIELPTETQPPSASQSPPASHPNIFLPFLQRNSPHDPPHRD